MRRNNSFSVRVGGVTFVLGVFPVENMLHFFMTITVDDGWLLGNGLIGINIDQHLDIVVINIQRSPSIPAVLRIPFYIGHFTSKFKCSKCL